MFPLSFGSSLGCVAQGRAKLQHVKPKVTCVPKSGREGYYVKSSITSGSLVTATCNPGDSALSCNCIASNGNCGSFTGTFAPIEPGVCQLEPWSTSGVTVTALCGQSAAAATKLCKYPEPNFDCAGVCLYKHDCAGICNGPNTLDSCRVCDDNPQNDGATCSGCTTNSACNYYPKATFDDGSCYYETPLRDCNGNCKKYDCAGVCGGNAVFDGCDPPVCNGLGYSCGLASCPRENPADCLGECGGAAKNDPCGVCNGDSSTCSGCTKPNACNHDPNALVDQGCIMPEKNYDCFHTCIAQQSAQLAKFLPVLSSHFGWQPSICVQSQDLHPLGDPQQPAQVV